MESGRRWERWIAMGSKRASKALTATSEHLGTPFTMRLIEPAISSSMTRRAMLSIPFVRQPGKTATTTTAQGFIAPATLVIEGLAHPIEITVGIPKGWASLKGLAITSLTIPPGDYRIENDTIPRMSHLLDVALRVLSCRVEVTPRDGQRGGRIVSLNAIPDREWTLIMSGRARETAAGKRIAKDADKRKRKTDDAERRELRGDRPHWDDPQTIAALRKVVANLPPLNERKGRHAYVWVRDELALRHGLDYKASTVKVMMSKHGLTKKRGKK